MPKTSDTDYDLIFDKLPHSYILFRPDDPDFTIAAENRAHAEVAMVTEREVVGKPVLEAFPDTSPRYRQSGESDLLTSLRKVVATGKPDVMEVLRYDLKRPDGSFERRYWRVTHYPIYSGKDSGGTLQYVCQATVNITDEILAGRRLDETKRQLDEALSIGLIGTWLWDIKEDYIVADKNLLKMFGLRPEDAVDGLQLKTFVGSVHKDDRARIRRIINETVKQQSTFEEEYRTVSRDGDVRWVIARGRVETDDTGKAVRFPGVIVDITERKQTEQNLRFLAQVSKALSSSLDYNKTLRSVAKLAIPDLADWCTIDILEEGQVRLVGIAHKDPKKVAWAKRYRRMMPVGLDDPSGVAAVLRTGKSEFYPVITDEMLVATSRTKEQLALARGLNLTSAMTVPLTIQGETIGAITLITSELQRHYTQEDLRVAEEMANRASLAISNARLYQTAQDEIAFRSRLEEQLRDTNEHLESRVRKRTAQLQETNVSLQRSNQELQDFAYVASHDLQEPLRKIQAFGNLLEEEFGEKLGDGQDYLDRMRNAASRMSTLIEDLLAFSRVTTKANPLAEVDLDVIVNEVVGDLEVRIKETGGDVEAKKLPTVIADGSQMRQLFQNLIGNALKFAKPGVPPIVRVSTGQTVQKDDTIQYCQIHVADNGIGFDEKYLDRIFSVFQRLHSKEDYQGTGIGLAICRKIAERHGGSITARSTLGKGSTFIVTLPCSGAGTKMTHKDDTKAKGTADSHDQ